MTAVSNYFATTLSTVADGTRAQVAQGAAVTPGVNAYGSWVNVLGATSRAGYVLEVMVNNGATAGSNRDTLVTVGIDVAGGSAYVDFISDLLCSCAAPYSSSGPMGGYWYRFPVFVPAGATLAAKASVNNGTVGQVRVAVRLACDPSLLSQIRVGTFVRSFGATPASSSGTAVTPGTTAEGAWTLVGTTAEALWGWEVGLGVNNGTMTNTTHEVDLGLGSTQAVAVYNHPVFENVGEVLVKFPAFAAREVPAGTGVYVRVQSGPNAPTSNTSVAAYGVGGDASVGSPDDPTLDAPSPAAGVDLAADRQTAKRTPVSFRVNNPAGLRFVVWAKFRNDDRGFVVYDSAVGFLPPFDSSESRYAGGSMTVLQVGGWQDDLQWVCVNGNGNPSVTPVRPGASGSDDPPHAS